MLMLSLPATGVVSTPGAGAVLSMLIARKPEAISAFLTLSRTTTDSALAPSRGALLFSGSLSLKVNCM